MLTRPRSSPPPQTGRADQPEIVTPPAARQRIEGPKCAVGDGCGHEFSVPFVIHEIGQTDTAFYLALKYRGGAPPSATPAARIEVGIRVDGCKVRSVTPRGAVRQARDAVSWIELPVSELPDGEFEITLNGIVGTAAVLASMPFVKNESGVSYLAMEQRQGYGERLETDPLTGRTEKFVLHTEPEVECPQ